MNRITAWLGFSIFLSMVPTVATSQGSPQQSVQAPGQVAQRIESLRARYVLSIDKVERSGPSPSTVFTPTSADVLYDSTPITVSFTFSNHTPQLVKGRIIANFSGGSEFALSSPVDQPPTAPDLHGVVTLNNPPSGNQTLNLLYQELSASPVKFGALPTWETKASDSQSITVIRTPVYVQHAPFDLVYDGVDDNGFPLNPRWGKQDEYFFRNKGNRDLFEFQSARPRIYRDCLNAAERQDLGSSQLFNDISNDYNPFRNGYCKHSPGVANQVLDPSYCQGDKEVDGYQPNGPINCAAWSWKDEPWSVPVPFGATPLPVAKCPTSPFLLPYHLSGHLNFTVVTYDGILNWDNAQPESFWDSDWCVDIFTPYGAGVASEDPTYNSIHMEVDPHNIGDQFDREGFWKSFRDKIQDAQRSTVLALGDYVTGYSGPLVTAENAAVAPMINGHRAIAIGLLALDMGHNDAGSELHPLFGLAIHTTGTPLTGTENNPCRTHDDTECQQIYLRQPDRHFDVPKDPNDDVWAIWAASYGNSGYCSTRALHVLDGDQSIIGRRDFPTMTFRIPWAKDRYGQDMQDVEIIWQETNFFQYAQVDNDLTHENWDWAVDRGTHKGIVITFHLWPSDVRPYWFGDLHLKWTPGPPTNLGANIGSILAPETRQLANAQTYRATKAEPNPSMMGLSAAQQQSFAKAMSSRAPIQGPAIRKIFIGTPNKVPPPPPQPVRRLPHVRPPAGSAPLTPGAAEENAAIRRAICEAHGNRVPNAPADFCKENAK
jgi:hypothetical protein